MKATEFKISLEYNGGSTCMTYPETHRTLNACLNSVKSFLKAVMFQQDGNSAKVCITFDNKDHYYFFSLRRGNRLLLDSSYIERTLDVE